MIHCLNHFYEEAQSVEDICWQLLNLKKNDAYSAELMTTHRKKMGGGKSPGTVPLITFRHETKKIAPGFFKILSGMISHEWDFC